VRGEQAVAEWYEARGFDVVARNWRSRTGEIDLVVRLGELVVMCEVKTRTSDRFGAPEEAVTVAKARRIRRLAAEWLTSARGSGALGRTETHSGAALGRSGVDIRFDVASVTVRRAEVVIEVIEGAF
jgi:putative endonuclease